MNLPHAVTVAAMTILMPCTAAGSLDDSGVDSTTTRLPIGALISTADIETPSLIQPAAAGSSNRIPSGTVPIHPRGLAPGPRATRLALWSSLNVAGGVAAYHQSQAAWGASNGHFHIKSDWKGDGLAMSDEASHFFAAYQLSRVMRAGYAWTGVGDRRARRLGMLEAWLWMLAVEFPLDAYNPEQGFGVSDFLFNTAGVLAAYEHSRPGAPPPWDVKISVKRSFFTGRSRLIAYTAKQYDDYIYWLTFRPAQRRWMPLIGIGYATGHDAHPGIRKEIHLGIGASATELGALVSPAVGRLLRPLDFFFWNLNTKVAWR